MCIFANEADLILWRRYELCAVTITTRLIVKRYTKNNIRKLIVSTTTTDERVLVEYTTTIHQHNNVYVFMLLKYGFDCISSMECFSIFMLPTNADVFWYTDIDRRRLPMIHLRRFWWSWWCCWWWRWWWWWRNVTDKRTIYIHLYTSRYYRIDHIYVEQRGTAA